MIKIKNIKPSLLLLVTASIASFFAWHINCIEARIFIIGICAFSLVILLSGRVRNKYMYLSFISIFILVVLFLRSLLFFHFYPKNHIYNIRGKIYGFEGIVNTEVILKRTKRRNTLHQEYGVAVNFAYMKNAKYRVTGNILVKSKEIIHDLEPGDRIHVKGWIKNTGYMKPIGGFNYGKFLKLKGYSFFIWAKDEQVIYIGKPENITRRIANNLKQKVISIISSKLKGKKHIINFISALLLGKRNKLNKKIIEDFRKSGIYHILALSGLHMGMIFLFAFFVFSLFGLKRIYSFVLTGIFLILFTLLIGYYYSLIRALIMAICVIILRIFQRERDYLNSLYLAGFIIILFDPAAVFSVSFQLSFGATLGILLFYNASFNYMRKIKVPKVIAASFAITFSAQILIFPLLLYYFGNFYFISFFANLAVVPIVTVIVALSLTGLLVSFVPLLGESLFLVSGFSVKIVFYLSSFFAKFKFLSIILKFAKRWNFLV